MNSTAYSYIRFSSPDQAKGRSLQRQREACEAYCAAHNLTLATDREYTFLDAGVSGFKGDHVGDKGQLARFIRLVEDGSIERGSTLIVESLDRLSRQDVKTALRQFLSLTGAGIRVVTLMDGTVYDEGLDIQELLLSIFVMSRAHEESSTKSRRVRDAMRRKHDLARTEKRPMGHICPLWLRLEEGKFVEDEARVKVVRQIFDFAIEGRGKGTTAKLLNKEGIPSFKGTTWGPSSVDKILSNRAVLGEYQRFSVQGSPDGRPQALGDVITDYFPQIVDAVTFHAAADATRVRGNTRATRQTKDFNVWQGLAKCIHCGAAMHLVDKGAPPKGGKYLRCYGAAKSLCNARAIRLKPLEVVFRATLARLDSLALVKESGRRLQKELAATTDLLAQQRTAYEEICSLLSTHRSKALAQAAIEAESELTRLTALYEQIKGELVAEDGMSFSEFSSRLDENLLDYAGRNRANSLMKRLHVAVYMDRDDGCLVLREDRVLFGVAEKNGQVGYMEVNPWHKAGVNEPTHTVALHALAAMAGGFHLVPPMEAGSAAYAIEEDWAQAAYDAIDDYGQ